MNRPEGITESAWEKAEACFPGNSWNPLAVERVARAIQSAVEAERERAAKVAEERYTFESVNKNKKGFPYQSGHVAIHCAEQIAAAIRKGA